MGKSFGSIWLGLSKTPATSGGAASNLGVLSQKEGQLSTYRQNDTKPSQPPFLEGAKNRFAYP
jgi:hypothetical protein